MRSRRVRSFYTPIVLSLWMGLMGWQVYDGYLRPEMASETGPELVEPWEAFYEVRRGEIAVGYIAERYSWADADSQWIRDSSVFLSPTSLPPGFIGSSSLKLDSKGLLSDFVLRGHSLTGSFSIDGKTTDGALQIEVRRDGDRILPPVSVPQLPGGSIRFDLPLFGIERFPVPSQRELPLPAGTGLATRKIQLELRTSPSGRTADIQMDGGPIRIEMDDQGKLQRVGSGSGLELVVSHRSIVHGFLAERDALMGSISDAKEHRSKEAP